MDRLALTNALIRVASSEFQVSDAKDIAAATDVIINIGGVAEVIQSMITTSPDLSWCVDANIKQMKINLEKVIAAINKKIDMDIRTYTNFGV
jgi:hypothetical protein